ncbi:MAG TPA: HEAT repeat domain-containing protein [Geobacteraceae bacterium]|nr:HEAT repeat domain-containing protein [Geobacteraceae bacterium]
MEQRRKIDNSLRERHGIIHLLERLKQDGITIAEMEEIGAKLGKSGKRALSPLVRRLWREKSGDLISKYAYLLDFFDDEVWIDQLIQIALRRRDLEEEGKAALLAVLEEYGVDISVPPLATLLARDGGPLRTTLPRLLDQGDEGLVCFMEDFFFYSPQTRLAVIRQLPTIAEPRVLAILEILLGIDDPEIREETVTALGRVRDSGAAALLHGMLGHPDLTVRESVTRSLRRISFLGIDTAPPSPPLPHPPFYAAYAGPFDGTGFRTVWIARSAQGGKLAALYLQLHETDGVRAVWGSGEIAIEEFAKYLAESSSEEYVVEVAPAYALALVRDAVFRNGENGALLPPEFYVWRRLFTAEEIAPAPYSPNFKGYDPDGLAISARHIAGTAALLDDDYFAGWVLANGRVCDYAEEWIELEKSAGTAHLGKGLESILERFCAELVVPETERINRRLLLTADLMQRTGRDRELIELALAAAFSLATPGFRSRHHPFLKRLALESMDMAREALAEGYDLREYDDGDEWE